MQVKEKGTPHPMLIVNPVDMNAHDVVMRLSHRSRIRGKGIDYEGIKLVRNQRRLGKDDGVVVCAGQQGGEGVCSFSANECFMMFYVWF